MEPSYARFCSSCHSTAVQYLCVYPPFSIVEDSLIQYQIIPGFSELPLIHLAGWLSVVLDTIIPNLVGLPQSDVVNRDLSSSGDRYGMRLPTPDWSSGQVPNFFSNCTPLSAHCEVVMLNKIKINQYYKVSFVLLCFCCNLVFAGWNSLSKLDEWHPHDLNI